MEKLLVSAVLLFSLTVFSQDTAISEHLTKPLLISGYVEAYYGFDFNRPENNRRPEFLYNFNRHNEFTVNHGFVKATYTAERVRANLAVAVGTYMNANYAAEPGVLKNIFEANIGYKISKKKNLWFDIGIMPSHIGFESAIGKDNFTLTRSLVAENTPYFESGAKLNYTSSSGKWFFSALALNGWQRITRVDANSLMSWGTQVTYKPSSKVTLNYSTFMGTDKPDSARLMRYHNNLYGIFQFTEKTGVIINLDYGLEQKTKNSKNLNSWFSPVAILRFTPNNHWALGMRGEYFSDKNGVIILTGTANGFKTFGGSINIDFLPQNNFLFRLEFRNLNSKDPIFINNGGFVNNNSAVTFSTAFGF